MKLELAGAVYYRPRKEPLRGVVNTSDYPDIKAESWQGLIDAGHAFVLEAEPEPKPAARQTKKASKPVDDDDDGEFA